jgi:DNA-binding IscR family transcriptional regulator
LWDGKLPKGEVDDMESIKPLHRELLRILNEGNTTYASPMTSEEIGNILHVTAAHVRRQLKFLMDKGLVDVRRGPGGGYYIRKWG